jgi:hypothetical protein
LKISARQKIIFIFVETATQLLYTIKMEIKIALNTTGNEFMLQIGGGSKKRDENKLRISQHKV